MHERPLVSVIIPCRNEMRFIARCLDSIIANDYPKDCLEIWVIDGMSEDDTRKIVFEYRQRFSFIMLVDNPRYTQATALNIGIKQATGQIIVRMDAHCRYTPDYISQCVEYLIKTGADDVGGGLVTIARENTLFGQAIAIALSVPFGVGNSRFRLHARSRDGDPVWVDQVPFPCFRRDVFAKIGGFNEELVRSEDIEFHQRMKQLGCRTLFVPSIVSYYYARSDLKSYWKHAVSNGQWAVLPILHTSRIVVSPRHLVPLVFVSTLISLGVFSLVSKTFVIPLLALGGLYAVTSGVVSISIAWREKAPRYVILMPLVFGLLHVGYGIGSLLGLGSMIKSGFQRFLHRRQMRGQTRAGTFEDG